MATAQAARTNTTEEDRPPSRLMRVPLETYEAVRESAEEDRRFMNQQLAILVQEALLARGKAKGTKRKAS